MEETRETKKSALDWIYAFGMSAVFILLIDHVMSTPYAELSYLNPTVVLVILFIAALLLESKYMPYVGLLPSALVLYSILEFDWSIIPLMLQVYAQAGVVFTAASFILYYRKSGKGPVYNLAYLLYSLKTIFPIYLTYFIFGSFLHPYFLYSFIFFSIVTWALYLEAGI